MPVAGQAVQAGGNVGGRGGRQVVVGTGRLVARNGRQGFAVARPPPTLDSLPAWLPACTNQGATNECYMFVERRAARMSAALEDVAERRDAAKAYKEITARAEGAMLGSRRRAASRASAPYAAEGGAVVLREGCRDAKYERNVTQMIARRCRAHPQNRAARVGRCGRQNVERACQP